MSKKRTNISLDQNVYEKAKNLGINISQTSERALQIRIQSAEQGTGSGDAPAPLGLTLAEEAATSSSRAAADQLNADDFLEEFEQTCKVDWGYAENTTRERMRYAQKLVDHLDGHPLTASKTDLRAFIQQYEDENTIKTVRVIYGRFFDTELAESFKVNPSPPKPKRAPTQAELQQVYDELKAKTDKVAFLILATAGIRRRELMELTPADFEQEDRAIYPSTSDGQATKRQWVTFYSPDTESKLFELYDFSEMESDEPLFTCYPDTITNRFRKASQRAGTRKITPQVLRVWFCNEMGRLGVADRYIDAFCGRVPMSVLAKHYSDYTPRKLQEIYRNAGISVLT